MTRRTAESITFDEFFAQPRPNWLVGVTVFWRHFKGGVYHVDPGLVRDSETCEPRVIYHKVVVDKHSWTSWDGQAWDRKYSSFIKPVDNRTIFGKIRDYITGSKPVLEPRFRPMSNTEVKQWLTRAAQEAAREEEEWKALTSS